MSNIQKPETSKQLSDYYRTQSTAENIEKKNRRRATTRAKLAGLALSTAVLSGSGALDDMKDKASQIYTEVITGKQATPAAETFQDPDKYQLHIVEPGDTAMDLAYKTTQDGKNVLKTSDQIMAQVPDGSLDAGDQVYLKVDQDPLKPGHQD